MPRFGAASFANLSTCDPQLIAVAEKVVLVFDCSCIEGHRSKAAQNAAFNAGLSHLRWPNSEHNKVPSRAIHLVPYPIDWKDRDRFHYFAGYVKRVAIGLGIPLRWGGDWDGDWQTRDNAFDDLAHYELED